MEESPLNAALRQFEAAEANLVRAERLWEELEAAMPSGQVYREDPGYDDNCRSFHDVIEALPKIDGWKPEIVLMSLDEVFQNRFDAAEVGEPECYLSVERMISEPGRQLAEYRYRLNRKRQEMIRGALETAIDQVDRVLRDLSRLLNERTASGTPVDDPGFEELRQNIAQINTLLGSSCRPDGWSVLERHLRFGEMVDLRDILEDDWPSVRSGLRSALYGEKEPVPVQVEDLGSLVGAKPSGPVATKLRWEQLSEEGFERLIFALISSETGYENAEWLTKTNAPDRGRDLSVTRVYPDSLAGTFRQRVIIQCKHWTSKSVGPSDIATVKEQMKLSEPPRVDVLIIATSGRFSSDAVAVIEKHNQSDSGLRIEPWPESHLERLLASRPALIAEFHLR